MGVEDKENENGGQTAIWTPLEKKEVPQETSYQDLFSQAKEANADQFKGLREQSAKDLLDANIQTELAKVAANKGLSTRLNAMGLGNSGYAGTQAGNIQAAYMQGLQQNQASYQDAFRDIAQQENDLARQDALREQQYQREKIASAESYNDQVSLANARGAYEEAVRQQERQWALEDKGAEAGVSYAVNGVVDNIAQSIDLANSDYMINEQLSALGISYEMGADGKITLNGDGLEGLSSADKTAIKDALIYAYESKHPIYTSYDDMVKAGLKTEEGNGIDDSKWGVKYEIQTLFNSPDLAKDGQIVKLQNGNNGTGKDWVYMVYNRGGWRVMKESEVPSGAKVDTIKGGKIEEKPATAGTDNTQQTNNETTATSGQNETTATSGQNGTTAPSASASVSVQQTSTSKLTEGAKYQSAAVNSLPEAQGHLIYDEKNQLASKTLAWELETLFGDTGKQFAKEGTIVKLQNGNGSQSGDYLYMVYNDGGWKKVKASDVKGSYEVPVIKQKEVVSYEGATSPMEAFAKLVKNGKSESDAYSEVQKAFNFDNGPQTKDKFLKEYEQYKTRPVATATTTRARSTGRAKVSYKDTFADEASTNITRAI